MTSSYSQQDTISSIFSHSLDVTSKDNDTFNYNMLCYYANDVTKQPRPCKCSVSTTVSTGQQLLEPRLFGVDVGKEPCLGKMLVALFWYRLL